MPITDGLDFPVPAVPLTVRRGGTIRPVRVYLPADEHGTRTVRTIGYRATHGCGERSRVVASWAMARGWLTEHRRACKDQ